MQTDALLNSGWREDEQARLDWLVGHFEQDAPNSRKLIREMLDGGHETFLRMALPVLRSQLESRGGQYLITLLVANQLLLPALCDSSLSGDQAAALVRGALRVDRMADVTLAKALAAADGEGVADPGRLMDILEKVSDGTRILPSLLRLLRHEDPRVRSKAVLMIGRGSRGVRWVERRMTDGDRRVRANAIESLWGVDTGDARELLQKASQDADNRVAGNALLGLYVLGECSAIPEVVKLSESGDPRWRSTALWVMGETGDARFLSLAAEKLRDQHPMVRRRAYWALGRIKANTAKMAQTPEWRMVGCFGANPPGASEQCSSARHVHVALGRADGKELPPLLPTNFLLTEDGRAVHTYQVVERDLPAALTVGFVFPRNRGGIAPPWVQGALEALAWKRNSDIWGISQYRALPAAPDESRDAFEEPVFCASTDAVRSAFERRISAPCCPDLWTAIWNTLQELQRRVRGQHRLIVFSNAEESRAGGLGLISAIITSATMVQVISSVDNPRLQDFCARTRGLFRRVEGEEAARAAIAQSYLQLLARNEISYQPLSAEARSLKVRAQTTSGWGEITLAIPRTAEPGG